MDDNYLKRAHDLMKDWLRLEPNSLDTRLAIANFLVAIAQAELAERRTVALERIVDKLHMVCGGDLYGSGHIRVSKIEW